MKKIQIHFSVLLTILLSLTLLSETSFAQNKRNRLSVLVQNAQLSGTFKNTSPFAISFYDASFFVKNYSALTINSADLNDLYNQSYPDLNITIPFADGSSKILSVVKTDISAEGFEVTKHDGNGISRVHYDEGLHYRGIIKGDLNSLAAVSIFNDEIVILFADNTGNYVVGKIRDNSGKYLLYNDRDVLNPPPIECATNINSVKNEIKNEQLKNGNNSTTAIACKTVKCYYEADFAMYQAFSSNVTSTTNYVTSIFNQKATLYANEGITVEISQILVWTVTDPYATNTTTSTTNSAFISQTGSSFNGDMANLLTTRNLGGGIAQGFSGLCNKSQAHCTSMIYTTYSTFPTYSWTIMVITHEMGHLLGSRHTHACVWNGNNTAIDGCAGSVEGSCALPPNPPSNVGGTIMSYCHLTSSGINFNNGFGPQPGALILGNVNSSVCLTGSGASTPTGMSTGSITSNSAVLSWNTSPGATQYTVEYKLASASSFTTLGTYTTNSAPLTGLVANTPYTWRVNADCSPFSADVNFTTTAQSGCGIPNSLYASNISSVSASLNWGIYSGVTTYKVRYRKTGTTAWTQAMAPTSPKNISGLLDSTQYEWQVRSKCSGSFTAWSAKNKFKTQSSSPPSNYCTSGSSNQTYEYISNTTIGAINNTTTYSGGYSDYTSLNTSAAINSLVTVSITLYKTTATDLEYVTIYADFNRDGDFDDAGESAYSSNGTASTFAGSFTIPATASVGQTRMRVVMQYNAATAPCGTYTYGETEDYILNITATPRISDETYETETSNLIISPVPVRDFIKINIQNSESEKFVIEIYSVTGSLSIRKEISTSETSIDLSQLTNGFYFIQVTGNSGEVMNQKIIKD